MDELQQALTNYAEGVAPLSSIVRQLNVVQCFTTMFARWEFQEGGLLVQLFPRNGQKDEYFEGRWTGEPKKGGRYVPGRLEQRHPIASFPKDMTALMDQAAKPVWMGDVGVDYVEELDSYVLLFKGLEDQRVVEEGGLLDRFLDNLDNQLDP